jgi:hypothetical protein
LISKSTREGLIPGLRNWVLRRRVSRFCKNICRTVEPAEMFISQKTNGKT